MLAIARHSRMTHGLYLSRCSGYTRWSIFNNVVSDMIMSQVANVVTNIFVTVLRNRKQMKAKMTVALKENMTTIAIPYMITVPHGILETGIAGTVLNSVWFSCTSGEFMMWNRLFNARPLDACLKTQFLNTSKTYKTLPRSLCSGEGLSWCQSVLVQIMDWCYQVASHYWDSSWPRYH